MTEPSADRVRAPLPSSLSDDAVSSFLGGVWQLNRRLKQLVSPALAQETALDLQRLFILKAIEHGAVYPKQLSSQLGIIPTQLSRLLEQLIAQQYVSRQFDPADSRRTRLNVTDAGTAAATLASQIIRRAIAERMNALSPERLAALLTAIDVLTDTDFLEHP
ncbi:transcriptional regulator [Deinococcus radiotolerans]|uniref:Transcriptional regulator n=1 Tax=Deinococcus radiotolerans TaxID=1309407 RepID=A0ABQ2FRJ2_9DEIO|nr:transcriptional regulator [Deinococcus radiotolerans]